MLRPPFSVPALTLTLVALTAACASTPTPALTPQAPAPSEAAAPAIAATPPPPPPALSPLPDHLADWIDAYASAPGAAWGEAFAFSGYLLVARDGVPVLAKAYGKANRATGAPADGDTRFRIGSITKQFTAVSVLQLAERGLVHLDDPLSKYVPGLPFGDRVTLHHLLSQTSGVASYTDDEALMKDHAKPRTHAEVVASFAAKPLAFEPGAEFRYSNSNYFLLGMVIEKVTGATYEDYLQRKVLGPAGMTRTSTVDAPDAPNTAIGYQVSGDALTPAGPIDMSVPFSAGAIRSTANDLVRWDHALAGDALLTADSKRKLFTPVHDDYAYGFVVSKMGGHEVEWHNGGIDGFTSHFARVPDEHLVVVALSNLDTFDPDDLAEAILKMALTGTKVDPPTETPVVPNDTASLTQLPGTYALDPASDAAYRGKLPETMLASVQAITIVASGAHLSFKPNGQRTHEIFRRADGVFFTKGGDITFALEKRTGAGAVPGFVLEQGKLKLHYARNPRHPNR